MGVQPSIRQIGKYTVIDVIGAGGMGIVFRAHDPAIGRTVAIKMLKKNEMSGATGLFDRFFSREMKSTGSLNHKNIVTVFDSGEQDGNPYLVMEYLDGEPISKLISEHRSITLVDKLDVVIQICDGLQYAHDRNIIHRDVKPANVILLSDGTVKIVDFGVARIAGRESSILQTGQLVGSLSYMSPEQINSLPIDARSDIFSSGVLLYELLTFELPFKGADAASTFVKILREDPLPLSHHLRDFPPTLQTALNRALAKNVNERFQTAEEFGFDLLAVQRDLKEAMVSECMRRADAAMQRGDLDRARDQLLDVIRLDRQNERANRLLREVRKSLQRQQRSSQVDQMRSQAQVALAGLQYEEALACADQALRLDPTDPDSIRLVEDIRSAISRAKAVREALNRAESALFAGDFDEAKEAVEESMRLAPNDSEARALASVVNKELAERSRRRRVQEFVDQARKGIAERKFTDALDALHRAEELDPSDSNVRELLQWAQRGQEQEKKRRSLQEITDQIEKALHAGDFSSACTISEMGLQRFPEESTLLRLRAISEKQRDIAERRQFVHDQSLAVKVLTNDGKLSEAVQMLNVALRKYPGEPNLESLLALTKGEIERHKAELEETARLKAIQIAEMESRARMTQQALNWSIDLRRALDARADLAGISRIAGQLRTAIESKQIDDHARQAGALVLNEVDARMRARDQALTELDQLRRVIEQAQDAASLTEADNRLLSVKAAFPNDANVQTLCADLVNDLVRVRQERDRVIASLTGWAQSLDATPTGELDALEQNAKEAAARFEGDARVGALLQQIASSVSRRLERRAELLSDIVALSADVNRAHTLDELARMVERGKSIAALDRTDTQLAEYCRQIEADAARVRGVMDSLLREMQSFAEAIASAANVHEAEALVPQVKALIEGYPGFQELQEAASRILAEAQGRRIEHDLTVQELESIRTAVPTLVSTEDIESAAARANKYREVHSHDQTIVSICSEIETDVERILRERAELRARILECDNAIKLSSEHLQNQNLEGALAVLLAVEGRNPDRADLHLQITVVRKAIEEFKAEQQRQEHERIAREKAEAEARARRAAAAQAIHDARELLAQGQEDQSLRCLHSALERDPESQDLHAALESIQTQIRFLQSERERLERERIAREKAEAEARARKAVAEQAIHESRELLAHGEEEASLQRLRTAIEVDPESRELHTALASIEAEIARLRAERERQERERLERERIAREKAEAEARAREEARERAIQDSQDLLAQGREDESLQCLRDALERDSESQDLHAALDLIQAEVVRLRAEREQQELERLERERIEREKAEAEAQARKAAAEQAIQESFELLTREQEQESLQRLHIAIEHDPESHELHSALETVQAEVANRQAKREWLERERQEQERIAREKAEAEERARKAAAEQAIHESRESLARGQENEAIHCLAEALQRDPQSEELRSTLESTQAEVARLGAEREREERERLERERIAREKAEAEARARKAAAEQAVWESRELLTQKQEEESVQRLRDALDRDPESQDLRSALEATQAEVALRRAEREREEQERLERERIAREKAEAEARALEAATQAMRQAQELLSRGEEEASLQTLRTALERDPESLDLQSALESTEAEVSRLREERERQEQERLERERIAREKAEAEARARQEAASQALAEARELLGQGRGEESVSRLRSALELDPERRELQAALDATQAEVARQRLEQERLERERIAREKAEAEARARKDAADQAIKGASELLAQGRGEESVQLLWLAFEKDPSSRDLRSALAATQAEVERQRAEQERRDREQKEQERKERERLAREQAEAAERARKAAAKQAINEARKLIRSERLEEALQRLASALEADPESLELRSTHAELVLLRAEQERVEQERAAREKAEAEARARKAAADQAIQESQELLARGQEEESLLLLRTALEGDPESQELRATLDTVQAGVARLRNERERQEQERIAREKAEAEARARKAAADRAIEEARRLLAQGRGEQSVQLLRSALERDPESQELRSTLETIQAEVDRQRAEREREERERQERERQAREKAEAEARARKAAAELAIRESREQLARGQEEESLQRLRSALETDPQSRELRSVLDATQAEVARLRAERERLERERQERERLEREKAEAEARARKAAAELAISDARKLLARGKEDESLQRLRAALGRDPENQELQSSLESVQAEIAQLRAEREKIERERLERERIAREKAEAEALARKVAAEQAIAQARDLATRGQSDESLRLLQSALERDPANRELRSTLDSIQAEVARQRAEQERQQRERARLEKLAKEKAERERLEREQQERERLAKEKAEAEARARRAAAEEAIAQARELLNKGRGDDSLKRLRSGLESDPKNPELRTALETTQAELAKQREEQKRLERERAQKAKEKAEAEARAAKQKAEAEARAAKETAEAEARARKAEAAKTVKKPAAQLQPPPAKSPKKISAPSSATVEQAPGKWSLQAIAASPNRNRLIGLAIAATLILAAIIYAVVRPASMTEVRFEIDPPDSILAIDGKAVPCAGVCTLKLAPGSHATELTKNGYEPANSLLVVTKEPLRVPPLSLKQIAGPAHSMLSSMSIVSNLSSAAVTLDGQPRGDLSSQRLDLNDLKPGSHRIVVSNDGKTLELSVEVSDQGSVSVEGAKGLDENAVIGISQARDGQAIFCRCKGAELQIDGKKLQPSGRDRYKLPAQEQAEYALTLVRGGNGQPIQLAGADGKHAMVVIQTPAQANSTTSADEAAWNSVRNTTDVAGLRKFLGDYPKSNFAPTALKRIEDLSWERVRNSTQQAELRQFLTEFPNGQHALEAKTNLAVLQNKGQQQTQAQKDAEAARQLAEKKAQAQKDAEAARQLAEKQTQAQKDADAARQLAEKQTQAQNDAETVRQLADKQAVQKDREAIKQTLESYRSAYERKDLNALAAVWLTIPRAQFQQTFKAADKIHVTLDQKDPLINGDTATVDCNQRLEFVANGKVSHFDVTKRFSLRKLQGRWFIEKDN
jgi:serine/threonine protein kinase